MEEAPLLHLLTYKNLNGPGVWFALRMIMGSAPTRLQMCRCQCCCISNVCKRCVHVNNFLSTVSVTMINIFFISTFLHNGFAVPESSGQNKMQD